MAYRRSGPRNIPRSLRGPVVSVPVYRVRSALQMLEDRRVFHPDGQFRTARSFFTKPRLVISPAKRSTRNGARIPHQIGFEVPHRVAICVRRHARKEVMFAKRLTGKGAAGKKRRNFWSNVKC